MDTEDLRLAVYHHLADTGRAPGTAALAAVFGVDEEEIRAGLDALNEARHVVLRDGVVVMAHPFATTPLGFSVMGHDTLWWGGCAWDAFAIPHLGAEDRGGGPPDGCPQPAGLRTVSIPTTVP